MSSIQDRIRRLQSAESTDDQTRPASGTVEAAKARLSRGQSESAKTVSSIANRFAKPVADDGPKGPSVAAMREKVATAGTASTVQARAAKLATPADERGGSARVAAARGALDAGRGGGVSNVAGRFEKAAPSTPTGGKLAGRASIFENVAEAEMTAASPRANSGLRPRRNLHEAKADGPPKSGMSQRAAAFERPGDAKKVEKALEKTEPLAKSGLSQRAAAFERPADPKKIEKVPGKTSTLPKSGLSQRAAAFERPTEAKKPEREWDPAPKGGLAQRSAAFERSATTQEPSAALKSRALQAERGLERSRSATTSERASRFEQTAKPETKTGATSIGKTDGKARGKDGELAEVKKDLADMVAVSKELLAELSTLRKGLRAMETDRDRLTKRIKELEAKAK